MSEKKDNDFDFMPGEDPTVLYSVTGRIIKPTNEQLEAIKKYFEDIGMPDAEDYLDY
jgi:hypothetical protein